MWRFAVSGLTLTLSLHTCGHTTEATAASVPPARATYRPPGPGTDQGVSARCLPVFAPDWQPMLGEHRGQPPATPKPVRGKAYADPVYGTCVVRMTDHAADGLKMFVRTDYSRRQAFNADDTKIIVTGKEGDWYLYDVATAKRSEHLPEVGGDPEPQWHPTKPNILYHFQPFGIGMKIVELDIKTNKSRVVADLEKRIKAIWPTAATAWTKSEGSPSADARYWAFMVDDKDWHGLGVVTYDMVEDKVIASYDFAKNKKGRPDHLSMSPTGKYVVVSWDDGVYSLTRELTNARRIHPRGEHSDLALDANGEDVYVSIDYESDKGMIYFLNLRTGVRTDLVPTYLEHTATAVHFSGKAFRRPGWALVSTYRDGGGPKQWLHGKLFALELKAKPTIINIAHHHSTYHEYVDEPHASVNRDFTRIVFNSNWDSKGGIDVDAYMVELPKNTLPPTGAPVSAATEPNVGGGAPPAVPAPAKAP